MSREPDAQAMQSLQRDVQSAVELLQTLTREKHSHIVGKSQRLPGEELQLAKGLAFIFATKVGFIASAVTGHGFLIQRLPNSASGWSAPLVFDLKALGVGASAGISKTESVLILDTEHAVSNFLHMQASLDSEMTVAAGSAAREMHGSELNLSHPSDTFSGASYSVAHGAMIDVSFQGVTMAVKHSIMRKLYGESASEKDVLSGSIPQLPVLEPLTREIQHLQRDGPTPAVKSH